MTKSLFGLLAALFLLSGFGQFARPAQMAAATGQPTRIYLPLAGNPGAPTGGATSAELIDAALKRGEIDAETALTYKVFAVFQDQRLPARFRGSSAGVDHDLLYELEDRYAELSPAAKTTLRPFIMPPFHVGSWWDLHNQPAPAGAAPTALRICDDFGGYEQPMFGAWSYLDAPDANVRIWWQHRYPADAAKAKALVTDIGIIWAELKALMGREPLADGGSTKACRGGSDRIDISLVDLDMSGVVYRLDRHDDSQQHRPSATFMLLKRDMSAAATKVKLSEAQVMRAVFIHETMHLFQNAFAIDRSQDDYGWWMEATATWAIDYVEGRRLPAETNFEHQYAEFRLNDPDFPLETAGQIGYGSYLFPLYLQQATGGVAFVRESFERAGTMPDSLANLDGLIEGGLRKHFPEWTLRNLNRHPVDDYQRLDDLTRRSVFALDQSVTLQGSGDNSYALATDIKHVAAKNYRFTFDDPAVSSVLFINPFIADKWPTAVVKALVKVGGEWRVEDWTGAGKIFCRDLRAERVEELMIVISNTEWQNRDHELKPAFPPRLNVTNVGCRGWKFEGESNYVHLAEQVSREDTTTVKATFLPVKDPDSDGVRWGEMYHLAGATATWTHSGEEYSCSGSGTGTFEVAPGNHGMLFMRSYAADDAVMGYAPGDRRYNGFGGIGSTDLLMAQTATYTCTNGRTYKSLIGSAAQWFVTEPTMTAQISADGKTITGKYVRVAEDDEGAWQKTVHTYTWKMTALPPE